MWVANLESSKSKIKITPPKLCPICGLSVPDSHYKIKSKFKFPSNSFRANICKSHFEMKKEKLRAKFLHSVGLFSLSFILFLLFLSLFLNNRLLTNTASIALWGLINLLGLHLVIIEVREDRLIRKYIFLESFQQGCAISIKNMQWAEEFKKLNSCYEIKKAPIEQLKLYEKIEPKIYPIQTILMMIIIIVGEIIVISAFASLYTPNYLLIIDFEMINTILLSISLTAIIISGFNYFYLINYKIKNEKLKFYLKSN